MKFQWRVWLHGEEQPRVVETDRDLPVYAVAAAIAQAGYGIKQSLRAARVEKINGV